MSLGLARLGWAVHGLALAVGVVPIWHRWLCFIIPMDDIIIFFICSAGLAFFCARWFFAACLFIYLCAVLFYQLIFFVIGLNDWCKNNPVGTTDNALRHRPWKYLLVHWAWCTLYNDWSGFKFWKGRQSGSGVLIAFNLRKFLSFAQIRHPEIDNDYSRYSCGDSNTHSGHEMNPIFHFETKACGLCVWYFGIVPCTMKIHVGYPKTLPCRNFFNFSISLPWPLWLLHFGYCFGVRPPVLARQFHFHGQRIWLLATVITILNEPQQFLTPPATHNRAIYTGHTSQS